MEKRPELVILMHEPVPDSKIVAAPEVTRVRFAVNLMDEEVINHVEELLTHRNSRFAIDLEVTSRIHLDRAFQVWNLIKSCGNPQSTVISSSSLAVLASARSCDLACEFMFGEYEMLQTLNIVKWFQFQSVMLSGDDINAYNVNSLHKEEVITKANAETVEDAIRAWNLNMEGIYIPHRYVLGELLNCAI